MEKVVVEDSDWLKYYQSIKSVCPWAYKAYMNDKILLLDYDTKVLDTFISAFRASSYEAMVITCEGKTSKWLEQLCDAKNALNGELEWLWSHPEHKYNSTPVPCIILQDRSLLTDLRTKTGYYEDEQDNN